MHSWTALQADGHEHQQTLLRDARNHRLQKRATSRPDFVEWLRNQLKHVPRQTNMGRLQPLKAKE